MSTSSSLKTTSYFALRAYYVSNFLQILRHACVNLGVLMWFMLIFFHVKASPWPETELRPDGVPCPELTRFPGTLSIAQAGCDLNVITSTSNTDMQSSQPITEASVSVHYQDTSCPSHAMNEEKYANIVEVRDVVSENDQTCKIETITPSCSLKGSHGHSSISVNTRESPLETELSRTSKIPYSGESSYQHNSNPALLVADDEKEQAVDESHYFDDEADVNAAIQLYHSPSTRTGDDAREFKSELRKRRNPSEPGSAPGAPSLCHNSIPNSVILEETLQSLDESSIGFCHLSESSTSQSCVQSQMGRFESVDEDPETNIFSSCGISLDTNEHVQVLPGEGCPRDGILIPDGRQLKNNLAKSSRAPNPGNPSKGHNSVSSE